MVDVCRHLPPTPQCPYDRAAYEVLEDPNVSPYPTLEYQQLG